MKNAAEPNQAAADFNDALHYITSPIAKRSFAKEGIDLPKLLENAAKQGVNPLDAVLGKLDQKTRGMDPVQAAEYLGKLLHNQQAGMAILSLLQHKQDFLELRKTLDSVSSKTLDTDFATAFAATSVQLKQLTEQGQQLNRTLGEGFAPDLKIIGTLLGGLLAPLTWLNSSFPNITHGVLATAGGFLLLAAGVGIFNVVAPLFTAAWGLLTAVLTAFGAALEFVVALLTVILSPVGLVIAAIVAAVAAIGAAAYEIWEHWSSIVPFFQKLWEDTKGVFHGFAEFVSGSFHGDLRGAFDGLVTIGGSLAAIFTAIFDIAKGVFNDFTKWVDGWTGGFASRMVAALQDGLHAQFNGGIDLLKHLAPADSVAEKFLEHEKYPQLQPPGGASGGGSGVLGGDGTARVHVTVAAEAGSRVTGVESTNPRVPLVASTAPNAGPVLSRH